MRWTADERRRVLFEMVEDLTVNEWASLFGTTRRQVRQDLTAIQAGIMPRMEARENDQRNTDR